MYGDPYSQVADNYQQGLNTGLTRQFQLATQAQPVTQFLDRLRQAKMDQARQDQIDQQQAYQQHLMDRQDAVDAQAMQDRKQTLADNYANRMSLFNPDDPGTAEAANAAADAANQPRPTFSKVILDSRNGTVTPQVDSIEGPYKNIEYPSSIGVADGGKQVQVDGEDQLQSGPAADIDLNNLPTGIRGTPATQLEPDQPAVIQQGTPEGWLSILNKKKADASMAWMNQRSVTSATTASRNQAYVDNLKANQPAVYGLKVAQAKRALMAAGYDEAKINAYPDLVDSIIAANDSQANNLDAKTNEIPLDSQAKRDHLAAVGGDKPETNNSYAARVTKLFLDYKQTPAYIKQARVDPPGADVAAMEQAHKLAGPRLGGGADVKSLRDKAKAAIASGKDPNGVASRFKSMTGEDLDSTTEE